MVEKTNRITEEQAREEIAAALEQLKIDRSLGAETKAEDDNSSVDYHMDNIIKAGGGMWNETVARDYITNLATQVGQELEAPSTVV